MTDREKVIKGLSHCEPYGYCTEKQCPYYECVGCLKLLRDNALELLKAQEPGWISVKDKLPEDFENVLVYIERDSWPDDAITPVRKKEIEIGWQTKGDWHVDMCSRPIALAWMPLPEPPKEHRTE